MSSIPAPLLGLTLGLSTLLFSSFGASANLVTNGDFEAGNTGFTSGYAYAPGGCAAPTHYKVNGDPNSCHPGWASFGPQSGSLLIAVNGGLDAATPVWTSNTMTVINGGIYRLIAYGASEYFRAPADLSFEINGAEVGMLQLTGTAGQWDQFLYDWTAIGTSASISIFDLETAFSGNDFAVDNISFDLLPVLSSVPEPSTLLLFGAGLAALGAIRRRKAKS